METEQQNLETWEEYVNINTGEYLGEGIFLSREYVEKKQEAQVNKAEGFIKVKKKDEFSRYIDINYGSFYFNNYMKLLKKLQNNTALLFRFLYLCTYADYDGYLKENKYYLNFYKYIVGSGKISNDIDSFIIDMDNDKVEKGIASTYMNDYIIYDNDVISNKYIALTFDDGPNYNTNKVLDILEENNVPATFFVLGNRIKENENILKRMVSSKMEIGNHTFNHLLLTKYKEDKVKSEINDTSNLIFEVTGKYPTLFRPSYGSCNKMIRSIVDTPIIIWDIDTLDWKYHNSRRISSRVINKVKDGDIVLMHDIYSATANALEIIIPSLKSKGYTFVTVSDLFYYKNIPLEKGKVYGFAR